MTEEYLINEECKGCPSLTDSKEIYYGESSLKVSKVVLVCCYRVQTKNIREYHLTCPCINCFLKIMCNNMCDKFEEHQKKYHATIGV